MIERVTFNRNTQMCGNLLYRVPSRGFRFQSKMSQPVRPRIHLMESVTKFGNEASAYGKFGNSAMATRAYLFVGPRHTTILLLCLVILLCERVSEVPSPLPIHVLGSDTLGVLSCYLFRL